MRGVIRIGRFDLSATQVNQNGKYYLIINHYNSHIRRSLGVDMRILYDSKKIEYKNPFGALKTDEK